LALAAAWTPTTPQRAHALLRSTATEFVTEATAAQVFGRLADKKLLLDVEGAGTPAMKDCCHGGCDNCDYSRIFDEMNAGKSKWVACYVEREHIDGRRHEAPVQGLFGSDERLGVEEFVARLGALDARPSMGARPADVSGDFDAAACAVLVRKVVGGADNVDRAAWGAALAEISSEAHGIAWRPWAKALVG
jgi:hypothetical protein